MRECYYLLAINPLVLHQTNKLHSIPNIDLSIVAMICNNIVNAKRNLGIQLKKKKKKLINNR